MQSSVEKLEGLAYKATIELPAEVIEKAVLEQLKELKKHAKMDGFRKGKMTPELIKQKFGNQVRQDVISKNIEDAYRQVVEEGNYKIASAPQINVLSGFKDNESLKFEATFEVQPEIEVKGLNELEVVLPKSELTDADVDKMLDTLRRQQATFSENSEKAAEEGDRITIDFVGKLDGVEFEGGKADDARVLIGQGQMLPDFENGLKGMKVGDEKTFPVKFPDDYGAENLKGKTAEFTAKAKKLEVMNLPEVNEEFIKIFGIASGTYEDFMKAIRENMQRELENAMRRIRRERLFAALLEKNADILVPHAVLDSEMHRMAEEMQLNQQVKDHDKYHELLHNLFEARARERVQLGYLLNKLFEEKNIQLDQERVNERLESIASTYESPDEVRTFYRNDKNAKANLEAAVMEEQLIDELYQAVKITEENKDFQEVMNINSQARF